MMVSLSRDCSVKTGKVHRLVAEAFIGPPPTESATVNHIDFNKANNCAGNLEWSTYAQNLSHAVAGGRFEGAVRPRRGKKLNAAKARAIKDARAAGESCKSIAKRFAVAPQTILRVVNGNIWVRA